MKIEIAAISQFSNWLENLPIKERLLIRKRLFQIESEGHFGDCKALKDGLIEKCTRKRYQKSAAFTLQITQ